MHMAQDCLPVAPQGGQKIRSQSALKIAPWSGSCVFSLCVSPTEQVTFLAIKLVRHKSMETNICKFNISQPCFWEISIAFYLFSVLSSLKHGGLCVKGTWWPSGMRIKVQCFWSHPVHRWPPSKPWTTKVSEKSATKQAHSAKKVTKSVAVPICIMIQEW